jgi:hypothetical protein
MSLDLIFFGLVGVFAVIGFFTGFWMQVMRLGALVLAYLLAGVIGKPLGPSLGGWLGVPSLVGSLIGTGLAFILLYAILSTVGYVFLRRWERKRVKDDEDKPRRRTWERAAGAALGGAKVFLVLYLVLCVAVLAEKPVSQVLGRRSRVLSESAMAGFARNHNMLSGLHLPVVGDMANLGKIASDPKIHERVARDPNMQKVLAHPKIQRLLDDPGLVSAARRNDIASILSNPRLNAALEDPEVRKLLSEIDLSTGELK